jgi:Ca-activated chloride channel family protein
MIARARTPEARVQVLEQLEKRWPGDLRLKLRRMDALEAVGRTEDARRLADEVRAAPNADAQARTAVGELLVRLGDEPAARRAFSEIVEFAPSDPVARRRLGDLYRAHGWFEEALRQYETLGGLTPGDAAVLLLEAAAAAGAGRIDEALRLEQRVADATEPGAATGLSRVAVWWSTLRLALLRDDARRKSDSAELARLLGRTRRANVLHEPRPLHVFLTWAHPEADCELYIQLPGGPLEPATEVAPEFGISSAGSRDPIAGAATIEVRRPSSAAASGLRYQAELVVVWDEGKPGADGEAIERRPLEFAPGRDAYRFRVEGRKVEVLP